MTDASEHRHGKLRAGMAGLAMSLMVFGCSSVDKLPYSADANPSEEINRLDQDIDHGFQSHYDILANDEFSEAQSQLKKAKAQVADGTRQTKILDTLAYARGSLAQAKKKSESLSGSVKGILQARTVALGAGVRSHPEEEAALKSVDDDTRSAIAGLENRRFTPQSWNQKWSSLQKAYMNLELHTIQDSQLGDARAKVKSAIDNGGRKNTPTTLMHAELALHNADNAITADRHNATAFQPAVDHANQAAQLLTETLAATKRPDGVVTENAALDLVHRGRKINELDSKLSETADDAKKSDQELESAKGEVSAARQTLSLDKAYEVARKEFSDEDAEVYRQGNKLLIRLKGIGFPVGRSSLPEASLPLLSKVKDIADDLNPSHIVVEGHADSTGKPHTNMQLSQKRADTVATYLETSGIDSDKVEAIGYGNKKPIISNATKQGRLQNRRVDVVIYPSIETGPESRDQAM